MATNQNIRIRLKAFDHRLIDRSAAEIVETAKRTGARVKGPIPLPTKSLRVPVMKAPSGQGTSTWAKFEMRIHKRLFEITANERSMHLIMKIQIPESVLVEIELM